MPPMSRTDLKYWVSLCNHFGASAHISETYDSIINSYSYTARFYHSSNHIETCLNELDRVRDVCESPEEIEMALWYHDIVYKFVNTAKNEYDSAERLHKDLFAMGIDQRIINKMYVLILWTKHDGTPDTNDGCVIVDIDLSTLASLPEDFEKIGQKIRQEYSHLTDDEFIKGRVAFFKRMLDKPHIFQTNHYRDDYEDLARDNLVRFIKENEK